ncbi:MAG: hypothetical protein EBX40_01580 [Gammaproteobacteria bacterium]|nr:hypothetical protein [Gammaproteobacteria bacterium]
MSGNSKNQPNPSVTVGNPTQSVAKQNPSATSPAAPTPSAPPRNVGHFSIFSISDDELFAPWKTFGKQPGLFSSGIEVAAILEKKTENSAGTKTYEIQFNTKEGDSFKKYPAKVHITEKHIWAADQDTLSIKAAAEAAMNGYMTHNKNNPTDTQELVVVPPAAQYATERQQFLDAFYEQLTEKVQRSPQAALPLNLSHLTQKERERFEELIQKLDEIRKNNPEVPNITINTKAPIAANTSQAAASSAAPTVPSVSVSPGNSMPPTPPTPMMGNTPTAPAASPKSATVMSQPQQGSNPSTPADDFQITLTPKR